MVEHGNDNTKFNTVPPHRTVRLPSGELPTSPEEEKAAVPPVQPSSPSPIKRKLQVKRTEDSPSPTPMPGGDATPATAVTEPPASLPTAQQFHTPVLEPTGKSGCSEPSRRLPTER